MVAFLALIQIQIQFQELEYVDTSFVVRVYCVLTVLFCT
jgi:hypothetical protein